MLGRTWSKKYVQMEKVGEDQRNISHPPMYRIPRKDSNQNVSYSFVAIPTTGLYTLNQPRNTGKCTIPLFLFVILRCCSTGNDVSDT